MQIKKILLTLGLYLAFSTAGAEPPAAVQAEVAHLLGQLEQSGCEFFRNGDWHSATEARAHLERKYEYLQRKGLVDKTEHFIERAATGSSVSGKPYQVKCADAPAVASGEWLGAELQRYRQSGGASR